jgi:hypothetical protein
MPSAIEQPTKTINWGGVIKGVAIVSAVVVAGVAGFYALNFAAGFFMPAFIGNATAAGPLATGALGVASTIGGYLGAAWAAVASFVTSLPAAFVSAFGLTGTITAAQAASATTALSIAGATAGTVVVAHPAINAFNQLQFTNSPMPDSSSALGATQAVQAAHMHNAAHITQHMAADHAVEQQKPQTNWMDRFKSTAGFKSHAEAARASSSTMGGITPRDANFAKQVEADTANLNREMAK